MQWQLARDAIIVRNMTDPLFERARLAIEESRDLQRRCRLLHADNDFERRELRRAVFESASIRTEVRAFRENKE
ncbi:hypothetical protein [Bradyrhizobium sp. UFLA05-112]